MYKRGFNNVSPNNVCEITNANCVMRRVAMGVRREVRADFNDAHTAYNAALHRLTDGLANIHAWKHRGMSEEWQSYLLPDGVHLNNTTGMPKYVRSPRGAAMWHSHS